MNLDTETRDALGFGDPWESLGAHIWEWDDEYRAKKLEERKEYDRKYRAKKRAGIKCGRIGDGRGRHGKHARGPRGGMTAEQRKARKLELQRIRYAKRRAENPELVRAEERERSRKQRERQRAKGM